METIVTVLGILLVGLAPFLWIGSMLRRRNSSSRRSIKTLAQGPRYRDGVTTYDQFRGVRFNIEIEDPREQPSSRYQRRHSRKSRKPTKPWKKKS